MRIVNTLYNEPPDEIEQIVKMTDTEYEQIKDDRALLEEAVDLIEDLDATINSVAGRKNDFLARAKERGIG